MMLILNNEDVQSVLTMEITMKALEDAYLELVMSRLPMLRSRRKTLSSK
jgi:hypothetical protein